MHTLLLSAFGLPEAIFDQPMEALAGIAGEVAARAVLAPPGPEFDAQLAAVLAWRDPPGNQVATLDEPAKPARAAEHARSVAAAIYKEGRLDPPHNPAIHMVRSRSAMP